MTALAIFGISGLVVVTDPSALANPFGGISKNLGLFVCSLAIWLLSPLAPSAGRAKGMKFGRTVEKTFATV